MKKIRYHFVFLVFYSGFFTSDLFFNDGPVLYKVLYAALRAIGMVGLLYLYDCHNERKLTKKTS